MIGRTRFQIIAKGKLEEHVHVAIGTSPLTSNSSIVSTMIATFHLYPFISFSLKISEAFTFILAATSV